MTCVKIWAGLLIAGAALTAQAAPGRLVSPYSPQAVLRPVAAGPLITAVVTQKKKSINRGFLDASQYQQIRDGALEIVRRFPPKQYYYVTLGRSPTAISAFFDNLSEQDGEQHVNVPASNLRDGETVGFEAAWYAHLDRFIPPHVLANKQKIVLIDRSSTGATLVKVKGIFEQYLAHKGVDKAVEVIAFARAQRAVPINFIDVSASPELVDMNRGTYDNVAKYPWFYVGQTDPNTLHALPVYEHFKNTLRERMSRDPELHIAIAGPADK